MGSNSNGIDGYWGSNSNGIDGHGGRIEMGLMVMGVE